MKLPMEISEKVVNENIDELKNRKSKVSLWFCQYAGCEYIVFYYDDRQEYFLSIEKMYDFVINYYGKYDELMYRMCLDYTIGFFANNIESMKELEFDL